MVIPNLFTEQDHRFLVERVVEPAPTLFAPTLFALTLFAPTLFAPTLSAPVPGAGCARNNPS